MIKNYPIVLQNANSTKVKKIMHVPEYIDNIFSKKNTRISSQNPNKKTTKNKNNNNRSCTNLIQFNTIIFIPFNLLFSYSIILFFLYIYFISYFILVYFEEELDLIFVVFTLVSELFLLLLFS